MNLNGESKELKGNHFHLKVQNNLR